jgi:cytochrome c oxidase assembly protein subunit 15
VTALATFFLIIIGGIVTSRDAGLAVPDYPTTFQMNMFLFPRSRMVGAVYFEHAHRLFASMVGLTTVLMAIYLIATDRRGWLRGLAIGAVLFVIAQGLLGGYGRVLLARAGIDTAAAKWMAVIHGVLAQIFLGYMVLVAGVTSATWSRMKPEAGGGRGPVGLGSVFLGVLLVQLLLGALVRHLGEQVLLHMAWAMVVVAVGCFCGVRARAWPGDFAPLRQSGTALMHLLLVQFLLGFTAFALTGGESRPTPGPETVGEVPIPPLEAFVTTVHQAVGALILAVGVLYVVWSMRAPAGESDPTAA